jgi:hypothetical protein
MYHKIKKAFILMQKKMAPLSFLDILFFIFVILLFYIMSL